MSTSCGIDFDFSSHSWLPIIPSLTGYHNVAKFTISLKLFILPPSFSVHHINRGRDGSNEAVRTTSLALCPSMSISMKDDNPLLLLRGPLIIFGVLSALLAPFLAQLSSQTLGLLALLCLGFCVAVVDLVVYFVEHLRCFLSESLDAFVLDDVLKAIFDPEQGLIAVITASFLGGSAIYNLASNDEQRVRLLQSGLWVSDPDVARTVLYQPGGIKALLPPALLNWLQPPAEPIVTVDDTRKGTTTPTILEPPTSWASKVLELSDDESATALYEGEKRSIRGRIQPVDGVEENDPLNGRVACDAHPLPPLPTDHDEPKASQEQEYTSSETTQHPIAEPPMPHEVIISIIMENFREKLAEFRRHLPDKATIGITGATGALLLLLQIRSSRRARNLLLNILQSLATTGLSTLVMASATALLVANNNINTGDARLSVASTISDQVSKSLSRHWKGCLAALVLLFAQHRRSSSAQRFNF